MTVEVVADLLVTEGAVVRQLDVEDFAAARTGDATEVTLAQLLAAVDGLEGSTDGLETVLAAILGKLLAAPATEAKQDGVLTRLDAVLVDLAALATAAGQTAEIAKLEAIRVAVTAALHVTVDALPGSPAQEHSTAGSPASARLSDGSGYLGATNGRLDVSDGGVALAVADSALLVELGQKVEPADLASLATASKQDALAQKIPDEEGTWGYRAGVSGTVNVPASGRVIGVAAHSVAGGTVAINGGDSIPVPANVGVDLAPRANVVAPTLVFTGTDSYMVEFVT